MKRVLLFVLLSGVALASAAQEAPSSSVEVRGSQFQLPQRPYPLFGNELGAFTGTYEMSNGELMQIRRDGRRLFATVGARAPKELVALSNDRFVARDQQLRLSFAPAAFTMECELHMLVPRALSSTGGFEVVKLVAAR